MAIIVNGFNEVASNNYTVWESSNLRSTIAGHLFDCLVRKTIDGEETPIDCENGASLVLGDYTGNGLQERYAKYAGVKDQIVVAGSVDLVKDAYNEAQAAANNFINKAGQDVKCYQVEQDDVFGISTSGFTSAENTLVVGNYVVVDGNGKFVAQASKPSASSYGFIGRIHSLHSNLYYTIVRIVTIQNVDNN